MKKNIDELSEIVRKIKCPTVSEILEKSISKSLEHGFDSGIFLKIKNLIEETLIEYAKDNFIAPEWILKNNKIEHTDRGFKVKSTDDTQVYAEVFYPDSINQCQIIIKKGE